MSVWKCILFEQSLVGDRYSLFQNSCAFMFLHWDLVSLLGSHFMKVEITYQEHVFNISSRGFCLFSPNKLTCMASWDLVCMHLTVVWKLKAGVCGLKAE